MSSDDAYSSDGDAQDRFEEALRASPVIVSEQDAEMRYVWMQNPPPAFGLVPEDFVGKNDAELGRQLGPTEEGGVKIDEMKRRVLSAGVGERKVIPIKTPEGVTVYLDTTVEPRRDPDGKIVGITSVHVDVTEQWLRAMALQRQNVMAEAQQEEIFALFRSAFDGAPNGMLLLGADEKIVRANQSVGQIFEKPADDLIGTGLEALAEVHPGHLRSVELLMLVPEPDRQVEVEWRLDSGRLIWTQISASKVNMTDSGPGYTIAQIQDVSQRREARNEINALASIVETSADAIVSVGFDGDVRSWNRGAEQCFGFARDDILGRNIEELVPGESRDELSEWMELVHQGESLSGRETRWQRRDGTLVDVSVTISPMRREDGSIIGASTVARDITFRKEAESKLQFLADHDALTGLLNRRKFNRELSREVKLANRFGRRAAVMIIDMDNFKAINDSLGHQAGDQVICEVANVLRETLRDVDIVARIGGDEFAVFMPDGDLESVADRLVDSIRHIVIGDGERTVRATVSVGFAEVTEERISEDELLARADSAMYRVKEAGKNGFRAFLPEEGHNQKLSEGLRVAESLRAAIKSNSLVVHAQPILDLELKRVHQYELLVRMVDGNGNVILPGAFLPAADRFGLIVELDRFMIRQAIHLLSEWNGTEYGICVSVNISSKSMVDPDLFGMIKGEIEAAKVHPENLALEITETSVIENMTHARDLANLLKDLGCLLALDDFGAGFGSFYYLKHLPFDYLKIDGDFIRRLPENVSDQHMVEAITQLCARLGKKTVAEFVEDQQTLDLLSGFGVDFAQGFHVGKPVPVSEIDPDKALAAQPG